VTLATVHFIVKIDSAILEMMVIRYLSLAILFQMSFSVFTS